MSGSIEVPVALSAQNGVQVVDWKAGEGNAEKGVIVLHGADDFKYPFQFDRAHSIEFAEWILLLAKNTAPPPR
jgi:hypothetical protein